MEVQGIPEKEIDTLKITNPLSTNSPANFGALSFTLQYGSGPVQKSIRSCFSPNCVDDGTKSENAPESKLDCQRLTSVERYFDADDSDGCAGKNLSEEREENVARRSGGVTSETNHGIDFGLAVMAIVRSGNQGFSG
jgi:hypothetical protein